MAQLTIRRFILSDAEALSGLIRRNLMEVNSRDYPMKEMERIAAGYSAEDLLRIASSAHLYVACADGEAVGCGAISTIGDHPAECTLTAIFVLPELHGAGVGRMIMDALENDELFLHSSRAELSASVTARGFYEKWGYRYVNGGEAPDEGMVYLMEKTTHRLLEKEN